MISDEVLYGTDKRLDGLWLIYADPDRMSRKWKILILEQIEAYVQWAEQNGEHFPSHIKWTTGGQTINGVWGYFLHAKQIVLPTSGLRS